MRVISINIGRPVLMARNGRPYSTSINKHAAARPLDLTRQGFEGDRVADDRHHGGEDQAICCYPYEHYAHWREKLNASLELPAFGENLTTEGLLEAEVCIGDYFRAGSARIQVTQPRQPCWKLANKHAAPQLPAWINALGYTGFYLRVLEPGRVCPDDELALVERPFPGLTVEAVTQLLLTGEPSALLRRCSDLDVLGQSCRRQLADRLRART